MGYEVISRVGGGIDPMSTNFIACSTNEGGCSHKDNNCKGCAKGQGCDIDAPINGKCDGGGHKDFKCTRDGGCNPCMGIKSSRFSQY